MLRTWRILIRTDMELPDVARGDVLAETMGEALEMAQHPEAIAIPTEKM